MPAAYHRNRGLGGAEHPHRLRRRSCTGKTPGEASLDEMELEWQRAKAEGL